MMDSWYRLLHVWRLEAYRVTGVLAYPELTLYYVKTTLAGQHIALRVDAAMRQFVVEVDGRAVQRLAMKGLGVGLVPFATFVDRLCGEARTIRSAAYGQMVQHRLL